jgi:hypothetical protein
MIVRLNNPAKSWSPYLLGGAAVYGFGRSDGSIQDFHPKHYGLVGGAGFEFRTRDRVAFVEARYMNISPGGIASAYCE